MTLDREDAGVRPSPGTPGERAGVGRPKVAKGDGSDAAGTGRRADRVGAGRGASGIPAVSLALLSVLPAVVVSAWLLVALPLLVLHIYRPLPAVVCGLGLAVVLGRPAARVALVRARKFGAVPWWVLIGVLAVVVGFTALAYAHSANDVLVRRDPGTYAMSATWLMSHGTVEMPTNIDAFGGPNPHLLLASQGFYMQGSHIIPQFMTGLPVLLAVGGWIDGVYGVLHANAFIGMFALLAFAGLVARLIGPRWAPVATLVLALVQPELDVMRAAYSEPAAQLLMLGGLVLLLDALATLHVRFGHQVVEPDDPVDVVTERQARSAYQGLLIAGIVLGLVTLVRIDAVADLLPLLPFIAVLAYHRVRGWRVLTAGLAIGLAAGAFDGVVLALPYLKYVGSNLWDALAAFAVTAGLSVFGVYAARFWQAAQHQRAFRRWPEVVVGAVAALGIVAAILVTGVSEDDGPRLFGLSLGSPTFVYILSACGLVVAAIVAAWLALRRGHGVHALDGVGRVLTRSWPWLAAGLVLLTSAALFARPYFQTARAGANSGGANYIGQVQRILGMPSDPTRSYYENAMRWLSWYFGWFALLLALVGGCWLAFEIANGRRRAWLPALLVFVITTAAVLARPSITPDHPWADRRFVPVALPAVVMLAFAALALVVERFAPARSRLRSRFTPVVVRVVVLAATAGVVIPAWQGSSAALYAQTEKGEVALVHTVCAALRPGDVVVTFGGRATAEWTGTVRIMCHVPVTYLDGRDNAATLTDIGRRVAANGGRVMVLASGRDDKAKVNVAVDWPAKPFTLMTSEVAHTVVTRPGVRVRNLGFAWPLPFEMWLGPVVINGAAGG